MSQEDAAVKRTLQVRGTINAERLRAVLEKAGPNYQLGISIAAPEAGADPQTDIDSDAEAPGQVGDGQAPGREQAPGNDQAPDGDKAP